MPDTVPIMLPLPENEYYNSKVITAIYIYKIEYGTNGHNKVPFK
jgi:hypothetical protein